MNIRKLKNFVINKLDTELDKRLSYHGRGHTVHVLKSCNQYIKRMNIEPYDAYLLRTAAVLHDTGFIWDFGNHEEASIKYARKILPEWNYSATDIEKIIGMIEATKKPQLPNNNLEKIIADSDLDYLGTDVFYKVANKLRKELVAFNIVSSEEEWDKLQVNFLQEHKYHTPFAIKNREPVKQKYLQEIMEKWGWAD